MAKTLDTTKKRRLGVVDIGSNAIRSLVVEVQPDLSYAVLDDEREVVRLAAGLSRNHRLSVSAMNRTVIALKRLADIAHARGVRRVAVVATNAIRTALNGQKFVEKIELETGLRVKVISGIEEAHLGFESAVRKFGLCTGPWAVTDIGGGSAELVLAVGSHIEHIFSLPMGAVRFTEEFLPSDPVKNREFKKMKKAIRQTLKDAQVNREMPLQFMVASGGTANALAQMAMARAGISGRSSQGYEMSQADVRHLLDALLRRNIGERKKMPGLSEDRADIIAAGVAILYELMDYLNVNLVRVNTGGIRHAILHRVISRGARQPANHVQSRMDVAQAFGRSLGFEQKHAEHVKKLALSIFDQVAKPLQLDPDSRDLLAAASVLHDVGYIVGFNAHHKHSYNLIAHASLEGFTPSEIEIIAQVARYHRGAFPKKKHGPWNALSPEERRQVSRLAAILRIADALDRRHSQGIREVRCKVSEKGVRITLFSSRTPDVEIHGATGKAELFQEQFSRKVRFEVGEKGRLEEQSRKKSRQNHTLRAVA